MHIPRLNFTGNRAGPGPKAKELRMADWLFKSWIKVSVVSVILFFFYHLFISQKLEEECIPSEKDKN